MDGHLYRHAQGDTARARWMPGMAGGGQGNRGGLREREREPTRREARGAGHSAFSAARRARSRGDNVRAQPRGAATQPAPDPIPPVVESARGGSSLAL